jgi:acyl-CoA dehydrogenase
VSDTALLERLATDVFDRHCGPEVVARAEGGWSRELWAVLEETGLTRVGLSEARGGSGGGWEEMGALLRVAARYAAPVPLAETTALAAWALDEAGLEVPAGPLTAARDGLTVEDGRVRGTAPRTAFARDAGAVVAIAPRGDATVVAIVPRARCEVAPGENLAREPRDAVTVDVALGSVEHAEVAGQPGLGSRGALVRAIQIAGALERVVRLTADYAGVRKQFGRRLADFQAVQQELALLAGESAAATAAAEGAVAASAAAEGHPARAPMRALAHVAAAKVRTAAAATEGARLAHQVHGAIGVTYEHQLHHFTSRLWSWRDEHGMPRSWAILLGRALSAGGGAGTWAVLTQDEAAVA